MSEAGKVATEVQTTETPAPAGQPAQAKEPTLRDELSSALKTLKEKDNTNTDLSKSVSRDRDEQGKFAATSDKTPQAERKVLTVPNKDAVPVTPKPIDPPKGWTPAAKAKFAGLDPDVQKEVLRRETEIDHRLSTQDEDHLLGKKVRETAAPYLATIKAEGGTVDAAFGQFLNYAHIMRSGTPQQKAQALQAVAQMYNVPLGASPQQAAPNQAFESVNQRIDRLERERQTETQQRQLQEQFSLSSQIESFAAEPGHEHFDTVRDLMGTLMMNGQAKDLAEAYEKAIWANPEIRSSLTAQQVSAAEQKRLTEIQQNTGAAKWASGSVTGGPGGINKPNGAIPERSLGDELRANFQALRGRV